MSSTSHYLFRERAILFQATAGIGSATGAVASYALKTCQHPPALPDLHSDRINKLTHFLLFFVDTDKQTLASSLGGTLRSTNVSAAGGIVVASGALAGTATVSLRDLALAEAAY